jgi:hypothetical protein
MKNPFKTNDEFFIVCELPNRPNKKLGGPYREEKALEVKEELNKQIENNNRSQYNIPQNTTDVFLSTGKRTVVYDDGTEGKIWVKIRRDENGNYYTENPPK